MPTPETGLPDAWIRLWTPHRGQYLHDVRSDGTVEQECPFCSAPKVSEARTETPPIPSPPVFAP